MPEGTSSIDLRVLSPFDSAELLLQSAGRVLSVLPIHPGWGIYRVKFKETEPKTISDELILYGSMNLPISEGMVLLQIRYKDEEWRDVGTLIPEQGQFTADIQLEHAGEINVRALWEGEGYYASAESDVLNFELPWLESALTIDPGSTRILEGEAIIISGALIPSLAHETIELRFELPDGSTEEAMTSTSENGLFRYEVIPWGSGEWTISVHWAGSSDALPAEGDVVIEVEPAPCTLTCRLADNEVQSGSDLVIQGELMPVTVESDISLRFNAPNGKSKLRSASTDENGYFEYVYMPEQPGIWEIRAELDRPAGSSACSCATMAFAVIKGLINYDTLLIIGLIVLAVVIILFLLRKFDFRKSNQ